MVLALAAAKNALGTALVTFIVVAIATAVVAMIKFLLSLISGEGRRHVLLVKVDGKELHLKVDGKEVELESLSAKDIEIAARVLAEHYSRLPPKSELKVGPL